MRVKRVVFGFKIKRKANLVPEGCYSTFYVMNEYYIFSNIDYF